MDVPIRFVFPIIQISLEKYRSIRILTSDVFVSIVIKKTGRGVLRGEFTYIYPNIIIIYADIGVTDTAINVFQS
jgi:hypothetical protein